VKSAKLDLSGGSTDLDPERQKCIELYLKLKQALDKAKMVCHMLKDSV
jgi:hypothetical protein